MQIDIVVWELEKFQESEFRWIYTFEIYIAIDYEIATA